MEACKKKGIKAKKREACTDRDSIDGKNGQGYDEHETKGKTKGDEETQQPKEQH